MIFIKASRTVTYILRMCRQGEMVTWSWQKHQEQSLTRWGCADKGKWSDDLCRSIKNSHLHPKNVKMVRWSQKHQQQSLTCWEGADKEKWSHDLHRSIKSSHLQAEDVHTRRNDQIIFTEASRIVTYMLRRCRHGETVTWSSERHQEQSLTCWECVDKEKWSNEKWSDDLHKTVTYKLKMCRQGEMIRWSLQKHLEQSLTHWGCANKKKWSNNPHRSIKNSHLQTKIVQTRTNG